MDAKRARCTSRDNPVFGKVRNDRVIDAQRGGAAKIRIAAYTTHEKYG
jgi:hypothetical protein